MIADGDIMRDMTPDTNQPTESPATSSPGSPLSPTVTAGYRELFDQIAHGKRTAPAPLALVDGAALDPRDTRRPLTITEGPRPSLVYGIETLAPTSAELTIDADRIGFHVEPGELPRHFLTVAPVEPGRPTVLIEMVGNGGQRVAGVIELAIADDLAGELVLYLTHGGDTRQPWVTVNGYYVDAEGRRHA